MLKANEMNVLRKIFGKTKIDRIRSQQIRKSCGIQPIHECVERRKEWDEHVTRVNAERLVQFSRGHIPTGRGSQVPPKKDGAT